MIPWVRYGPHALLLRFADTVGEYAFARGRAIVAELERNPPPGLLEMVPGFTTLLLRFEPARGESLPSIGAHLSHQLSDVAPMQLSELPIKTIPVIYDGPDLVPLAQEKGLTQQEFIRRHSAPVYMVYLLGFSPGFPYLGELDPVLHTPRRATPRPRVPAGSVAIGGEHTGIYSVDSPGGWQIIGRTTTPMFAHDRLSDAGDPADVFFLRPGDRVRLVPAEEGTA